MWHVFTSIARTGGVAALWKGWVPNCTRSSLVCLGGECVYVLGMEDGGWRMDRVVFVGVYA